MKVLWLTREDPRSRTRGDLIYTDGLSRALSNAGATVTLLCGAKGHASFQDGGIRYNTVTLSSRPRALSLMSQLPSDPFRIATNDFQQSLKHLLRTEQFEVVLLDHAAMGWALALVEEARKTAPILLGYVSHNFEQSVRPIVADEFQGTFLKKSLLRWDARKYRDLERRLVNTADFVTAITQDDANQFKSQNDADHVLILMPGAPIAQNSDRPISAQTPRRAVIVGSFTWIAKQQNLLKFLQAASAPFSSNKIELEIVGRVPTVLTSAASVIFPGCRFAGQVESIQPFLREARIGVMPDELGGGFKLKMLDYIFNGIPVASIQSQSSGFPLEPDEDFIGARTATELVQMIVRYIDDVDALNRFRMRASSKCENLFSWEDRGADFYNFLQDLLHPKRCNSRAD